MEIREKVLMAMKRSVGLVDCVQKGQACVCGQWLTLMDNIPISSIGIPFYKTFIDVVIDINEL